MSDRTCLIDGCDRPPRARGWCKPHWERWRKHGSTGPTHIGHRGSAPVGDCAFSECDRPAAKRGWCATHYQQWRTTGEVQAIKPERMPVVTYLAAHLRLVSDFGSARTHACVDCGGRAHDWSYDHRDPNELTCPKTGRRYSLDESRYQPRCRSCHRLFDYRFRDAGELTAPLPQRTPPWDDEEEQA